MLLVAMHNCWLWLTCPWSVPTLTSDGHVAPSGSPGAERQPSSRALTLVVSERQKSV